MYSDKVRQLLINPINGRPGNHYNAVGRCENSVPCRSNPCKISTTAVSFQLWVDELGKIHEAHWQAFGDPVVMAAASWCTEQITGKFVGDLTRLIYLERIAEELNITDDLDLRGSCTAVINALAAAVDNLQED